MAITFDASGGGTQVGGTPGSGSFNITVGSLTNGVAIVGITTAVGGASQMTVTFGGSSMTFFTLIAPVGAPGNEQTQYFYLVNPPASGTKSVAWTQGASKATFVIPFAVTYNGVNQTTPINGIAGSNGFSSSADGSFTGQATAAGCVDVAIGRGNGSVATTNGNIRVTTTDFLLDSIGFTVTPNVNFTQNITFPASGGGLTSGIFLQPPTPPPVNGGFLFNLL
jgi:hypothetical protein